MVARPRGHYLSPKYPTTISRTTTTPMMENMLMFFLLPCYIDSSGRGPTRLVDLGVTGVPPDLVLDHRGLDAPIAQLLEDLGGHGNVNRRAS